MKHPFHLVRPSPWPILASISAFLIASGLVIFFSQSLFFYLGLGLLCLFLVLFSWFTSIIFEATHCGAHTRVVQSSLRLGFVCFILSEVFFFLSFFWAYLHFALSPAVEIGSL